METTTAIHPAIIISETTGRNRPDRAFEGVEALLNPSHIPGSTELPLKVLQVDPSLFTAPYDAALSAGLAANHVESLWATRALRDGEDDLLGSLRRSFFYRLTDGHRRRSGAGWKLVKGIEHGAGLSTLVRMAAQEQVDLVHFQWALVPMLDRFAIARLQRRCPVVVTVHDTTPLNGARGGAQTSGYDRMLAQADALIVHLDSGRAALVERGVAANKIHVVPHGPLPLAAAAPEARDQRWRIVLFGKIQAYKGVDVAIEALGMLPAQVRDGLDVVIAGEPMIDLAPLRQRIAELRLERVIDLRPRRFDESEMASLLRSADAFALPYRLIEASGVLHLIADLGRWIVASDTGSLHDLLTGRHDLGELVPAGDAAMLAAALERSIGRRPEIKAAAGAAEWADIGALTRSIYERLIAAKAAQDVSAF